MNSEEKTCDLVYAKETYINRFQEKFAPAMDGKAHDQLNPDSLPHRYKLFDSYGKLIERNYWKVIVPQYFI